MRFLGNSHREVLGCPTANDVSDEVEKVTVGVNEGFFAASCMLDVSFGSGIHQNASLALSHANHA